MAKPVPIKEILAAIMESRAPAARPLEGALLKKWKDIAGNAAAGHSRPVKFHNNVLVVCVENSCYVHDLSMRKREVLARIKRLFPQHAVKDIRFKVGSVST